MKPRIRFPIRQRLAYRWARIRTRVGTKLLVLACDIDDVVLLVVGWVMRVGIALSHFVEAVAVEITAPPRTPSRFAMTLAAAERAAAIHGKRTTTNAAGTWDHRGKVTRITGPLAKSRDGIPLLESAMTWHTDHATPGEAAEFILRQAGLEDELYEGGGEIGL